MTLLSPRLTQADEIRSNRQNSPVLVVDPQGIHKNWIIEKREIFYFINVVHNWLKKVNGTWEKNKWVQITSSSQKGTQDPAKRGLEKKTSGYKLLHPNEGPKIKEKMT